MSKEVSLWGYVVINLLGGGVFGPILLFAIGVSQAQYGGPAIFVTACQAGIVLAWTCLLVAWILYLNKKMDAAEKTLKVPIIYGFVYVAIFVLHGLNFG